MSEESVPYSNSAPITLDALKGRPCCYPKMHPAFISPVPEEVKALRNFLGLSQEACAKFTGVKFVSGKGSQVVRKWETHMDSSNHKPIPYSAWRLMLAAAKIVDLSEDLEQAKRPSS